MIENTNNKTKRLSVDNTCFSYCEYNPEGKQTIVMLHGFPQFSYSWARIAQKLDNSYRVICPDLKGFNNSSKPVDVEQYKISFLTTELAGFISEFSTSTPVILVGHDWGGILSWYLEALYPELIKQLVIINAPYPNLLKQVLVKDKQQQKLFRYIRLLISDKAEKQLSKNNFAMLNSRLQLPEGEERKRYHSSWRKKNVLSAMINYYKAYFIIKNNQVIVPSNYQAIEHARTPTTVIWSENGYMVPANYLELDKYVSNLKLHLLQNCSHWVLQEKPDDIAKIINSL